MRVLVVEDHERMADLIRRGLEEAGYAVDPASTGEDGRWMATENDYDAILLDVMLPVSDGFEVCRAPPSRRLLGPGPDAHRQRRRGRSRPRSRRGRRRLPDEALLHRRVTRASASPAAPWGTPPDPPSSEVDDLKPGPRLPRASSGRVFVIELTAKEFGLLECFMRTRRRGLLPIRLIDHVWDFAFDGDSNSWTSTSGTCGRRSTGPSRGLDRDRARRGISPARRREPDAAADPA